MNNGQQRLHFEEPDDSPSTRDALARRLAVDPSRNVALEASAGTGKTRVLVERYVALLAAGVAPRNILAITFTRKAAAEMRQRILDELARRHRDGGLSAEVWRDLRDHAGEIAISTIDAFCLALLREFPLEADVDPGFDLADETETPRLVDESLDRALGRGRRLAIDDPDVALLFAGLGEVRLRQGLARLLDRRIVAWDALNRFVQRADLTADQACNRFVARLRAAFATQPGGLPGFLATGPSHPAFDLLAQDLRTLVGVASPPANEIQVLLERVSAHLLTQKREPRKKLDYRIDEFRSRADYDRHKTAVLALGTYAAEAIRGYESDLNLVLARGVRRLLTIALDEYRRTLQKENVLDFSEVLLRTLGLLRQMDEFSRSRFRLESRYQHVLVDEFQDTSRAQWELVELLVRAWGEGEGLSERDLPPSIFIVGDRKQSIYGFRDAEVSVLESAARYIDALRPMAGVRQAITRSFRSVPEILGFVNTVFSLIEKQERPDAFRYDERDIFPVDAEATAAEPALGIAAAATDEAQADLVAEEVARLLIEGATIRDRETGLRRSIGPGDIALLFRTRESHRIFEAALQRRGVPFYVYKGLGFFDADEIKDVLALLAWLAAPESNLRAAAFLRSRFVRLSDVGLKTVAPALSAALNGDAVPSAFDGLAPDDRRRMELTRASARVWLALVDRVPPAELLDRVVADSAYAVETRGPGQQQAQENLKKIRGLVRRIQNRGYATITRLVEYFSQMGAGGDESNAIVDAVDAVNLMTVHAAKGLEFPVVFIVNLSKGSGGSRDPVRVSLSSFDPNAAEPADVGIGDYESDIDRDEEAREAEESKRLVYVAMTRARDRLYLATTLGKDGRFTSARGSLGRTLPAALAELVAQAGQDTQTEALTWQPSSTAHAFRVLKPTHGDPRVVAPSMIDIARDDRFDALATRPAAKRRTVSELSGEPASPSPESWDARSPLTDRAPAIYAGLLGRDDLRALVGLGRVMHEVPFSLRLDDGSVVRGTIDCLVVTPTRVVVVEVKTGAAALAHQAQLDCYIRAARSIFPDAEVEGRLIYSSQQLSGPLGV